MKLKQEFLDGLSDTTRIKTDEPLCTHTSFLTGGPADYFFEPQNTDDFFKILCYLQNERLPTFIMGRGTNLLVSDSGFAGAVIKPAFETIFVDGETITAQAGAALSAVCRAAMANGLSGLEFASGIPGSVGGALKMNAGAYGEDISGVLLSAQIFDTTNGVKTADNSDMGFFYRDCRLLSNNTAAISATFKLRHAKKGDIYAKTEELLKKRKTAQPLDLPSAGSVFKRPQGYFAGKLIEDCGLKGFGIGGAQVSQKHAGFIVNIGDATSTDIYALIRHVRRAVYEKTGVDLEPEVHLLGDF